MLKHLTKRQTQLIELASEGLSDVEASHRLGISVETTHHYWREMRQHFGKTNRAHIIAQYLKAQTKANLPDLLGDSVDLMAGSGDGRLYSVMYSMFSALELPMVVLDGRTEAVSFVNKAMESLIRRPGPHSKCRDEYSEWNGYSACGAALQPDQWPSSVTLDTGKPVIQDIYLARPDHTWVLTQARTVTGD